jgi:glycerophosphoryl diester phosphodiesterase
MPAFTAGAQQKCDFIELDVHLSKDGSFFVMHDPGLNRTTDIKTSELNTTSMSTLWIDDVKKNETDYFILNYTNAELDKLKLIQSNWTTSHYSTEVPFRNRILDGLFKIPKLDEVLQFCVDYNKNMTEAYGDNHKKIGIYVEIKYP